MDNATPEMFFFPDAPDTDPVRDDSAINDTEYVLRSAYQYTTLNNIRIYIPAGFRTDELSAPQATWSFIGLPPDGYYRACGVVHDFLYANLGKIPGAFVTLSRKACDDILLEILTRLQVPYLKRQAAYLAVRLFGMSHWKGN